MQTGDGHQVRRAGHAQHPPVVLVEAVAVGNGERPRQIQRRMVLQPAAERGIEMLAHRMPPRGRRGLRAGTALPHIGTGDVAFREQPALVVESPRTDRAARRTHTQLQYPALPTGEGHIREIPAGAKRPLHRLTRQGFEAEAPVICALQGQLRNPALHRHVLAVALGGPACVEQAGGMPQRPACAEQAPQQGPAWPGTDGKNDEEPDGQYRPRQEQRRPEDAEKRPSTRLGRR